MGSPEELPGFGDAIALLEDALVAVNDAAFAAANAVGDAANAAGGAVGDASHRMVVELTSVALTVSSAPKRQMAE